MKAFDLPTYPVADGMQLGRRTYEEYQWLIERGFFTSWMHKHLIIKINDRYQLLRNNAPEPELECEAPTLEALVLRNKLPITQFQWHPLWEEPAWSSAFQAS